MAEQKELIPGPPGSVLREARLNAGKSVIDVAEALNLLKTYVEALENNDYSRFNSPLFARGYIKSYARYMGLDEHSLLSDCDRICRRQDELGSQAQRRQAGAQAPARGGVVVALIFAMLVWSVSVWVFGGSARSSLNVEVLPESEPATEQVESPESLGESLLKSSRNEISVPAEVPANTVQDAKVALQVLEPVWLEMRDVHGRIVVSGQQPKGKTLSVAVDGPVTINVQDWPAVALQYNDKGVDLENIAKGKAVRLQVGER